MTTSLKARSAPEQPHSRRNSYVLLHDTHTVFRELVRHAAVKQWLPRLEQCKGAFECLDLPFASPGTLLAAGAVFGMIPVGSQVDLVVPHRPVLELRVAPGERVRAGESVVIA